jgi:hypothetical protein
MAFLDNAGDIILDAVLTDAGRQRLARGNFKIVKFAFGDEEINYELFNSTHPSGSAFYDLEVMQTPILEAFTNNASLMKSKLVSINRNNILYMPILKVNNQASSDHAFYTGFDGYYLIADEKTSTLENAAGVITDNAIKGIMHGTTTLQNGTNGTKYIGVDQGIVSDGNTDGLSINDTLPADMLETAYLVRVDHRLLRLHAHKSDASGQIGPELINQFVDDDAIATYFFAQTDGTHTIFGARENAESGFRSGMRHKLNNPLGPAFETVRDSWEMFKGPIGTSLRLVPKAATSVQFSSALFDKLGTASTALTLYTGYTAVANYKFIDTSINVTGITTGYSVDIPIRIVKGTY